MARDHETGRGASVEKEKMTCEMAWKLNREKLIRLANRNTFQALATAFETGWDLATDEEAKKRNINEKEIV